MTNDSITESVSDSKYTPALMLPALRIFVKARRAALDSGFSDNGGAIHSIERIVDILSCRLKYPWLSHTNNLKTDPRAEISVGAYDAKMRGEPIYIEHVMPQRAFARRVAELIESNASDDDVMEYMKTAYRLVLLTDNETKWLNKINRSKLSDDRIKDAKIAIYTRGVDGAPEMVSVSTSTDDNK